MGHIDALPPFDPELPAQVDILAIHEIKPLVEATSLIKSCSSDQRRSSRTPGGLTRVEVVRFGMLPRGLFCLTNRNPVVGFRTSQKSFQTARFQLSIRI